MSIASTLLADLEQCVNPERAEFMKGYAATAEGMLGVPVPDLRKAAKKARQSVKGSTLAERVKIAKEILALGYLESRQAAYEFLAKDASDLSVKQLEQLGKGIDNWATVDSFATLLVGRAWIAENVTDDDIARWAKSKNPWWRRATLASTVSLNLRSRGGSGDTKRTIAVCEMLVRDKDIFVQKALSWSLRSLVPWNANAVGRFLTKHRVHMPSFVIREVEKKLSTGKKN